MDATKVDSDYIIIHSWCPAGGDEGTRYTETDTPETISFLVLFIINYTNLLTSHDHSQQVDKRRYERSTPATVQRKTRVQAETHQRKDGPYYPI